MPLVFEQQASIFVPLSGPTILTSFLPNATTLVNYSFQLTAANGTPPYSWTSTPLGVGFTLSSSGLISGQSAAVNSLTAIYTVTDSLGFYSTAPLVLNVVSGPPVITTSSPLPSGTVGTPYAKQLQALGGSGGPYTFNLNSGTLPAGLGLSSSGMVSGTPTTGVSSNFTVVATDSTATPSAPTNFQLVVGGAGAFDYYVAPNGDDVTGDGSLAKPFSITWLGTMLNRTGLVPGNGWNTYAPAAGGKNVGVIGDLGPYVQGKANGTVVTLQSLAASTGTPSSPTKYGVGFALFLSGGTASAPVRIASCDSTGAYKPRLATIDFTSGTGLNGHVQSLGIGQGTQGTNGYNYPTFGNIILDGLVLNGGGQFAVGFSGNGVTPSQNLSVINCEIRNSGGISNNNPAAINFTGCNNCLIQNNLIHDNVSNNLTFQQAITGDVNVTTPNSITITSFSPGGGQLGFLPNGFPRNAGGGPQIYYIYTDPSPGSLPIASFTSTLASTNNSVPQTFALDQTGLAAVPSGTIYIGMSSAFAGFNYAFITFNSTNIQILNNTIYNQGIIASKDHYQGPTTVAYNYVEFGNWGGNGNPPVGNPLGTGTVPGTTVNLISNVVAGVSSSTPPYSSAVGAPQIHYTLLPDPTNLTQNYHHNVFVLSSGAALISGQDTTANEQQITFDHNTFFYPGPSIPGTLPFIKMANSTAAGLVGKVAFTNNVVWSDTGSVGAGAWYGVTGTQNGTALAGLGGITADHNGYPSNMTWGKSLGVTLYSGLPAWQTGSVTETGSGQDAHSISLATTPFSGLPQTELPSSFAVTGAAATASSTGGPIGALDGSGSVGCSFAFVITNNPPPAGTGKRTLPAATVGTAYSTTLTVNGGSGNYQIIVVDAGPNTLNWLTGGQPYLPYSPPTSGLTWSPGTPQQVETGTVTLMVKDTATGQLTPPVIFTLPVNHQ